MKSIHYHKHLKVIAKSYKGSFELDSGGVCAPGRITGFGFESTSQFFHTSQYFRK